MKLKRNAVSTILLASLLCGCTQTQEIETIKSNKQVPLSLCATSKNNVVVKSTDPFLPKDVTIGVYVTAKDADLSKSFFSNIKYTSLSSGELTTSGDVNLTVGSSYDICAYAPHISAIEDPLAVEFAHGTDVLWAPKAAITNVTSDNRSAALAFEHKAAQISFQVVFGDNFVGQKVFTSDSKIEVSGFYSKGSLNVFTGVLTPTTTANYSVSNVAAITGETMTLGITPTCFIPASGEMTLAIKVIHQGAVYNGTLTNTFAGKQCTSKVTINSTFAPMNITGTLKDWVPVSGDVNVQ